MHDLSALAHDDGDGAGEMPDDGADRHKMAEASIKAFFEAGKAGKYAEAAGHFAAAMEHCEAYGPEGEPDGDEGPDGEGKGGHALLLIPHKG